MIIRELGQRLIEHGVPLDRISAHFGILHPRYVGVSRVWTPEDGLRMERPEHSDTASDLISSPLAAVRASNDWVDTRIDRDGSAGFPVFTSLRAAGFTHYLMAPLRFSDDSIQGASFATRRAAGFSRADVKLLHTLAGPLALVVELKRLRIMSASMLAEYVGRDPAERILRGTVRRGDLVEIRAALMFTDLVGSSALAQRAEPAEVVDVLNRYFEDVDRAARRGEGEILKFVGDGVFVVFPDESGPAPARALRAAREILEVASAPVRIALHEGVVSYGNVGSEERLDFTAIGPDVNLLSRLEGVARDQGRPLVMSERFAATLGEEAVLLGHFATRGFAEPLAVYAPSDVEP